MTYLGGVLLFGGMFNLITDVFRHLFFFLDGMIYGLIPVVYNLIYTLYDFSSLLNEEAIALVLKNVSTTIYSFLAIFMFFRVAFSLITMLVDPAVIDDKEKGAKKIIMNVMICLVLIVAVPYGFRYAKTIQTKVLEEHIIERVVIGGDYSENYNLGDDLSLSILSIFIRPTTQGDDASNVYNSIFVSKTEKLVALNPVLNDVTGNGILSGETSYSLSYTIILSTFVGIYVLFIFVQLLIDVGYRSIKFIALELLSPIAIVSYIDPSSGKKGVFNKWLNETIKTYISLFIRIFVFSFVSVLLSTLNFSALNEDAKLFTKLFYILAIIAFIKAAPKFIDNLFGTSISKDGDTKFASDMFKGVLGGVATSTVGGIAGGVVAKRVGKNPIKGAFQGITSNWKKGYDVGKKGGIGAIPGVVTAAYGGYTAAKKKYGDERDPELEKLINELEQRVPEIDAAKSSAVDELMANDKEKYIQKLQNGPKVNGRKYGKGLEGDDGLENALKKNAGGLAKDEALHGDDQDYLDRRRLVADRKEADAIVSRTNTLAKAQYSAASDGYNSSDDKNAYVVSFEIGTEKLKLGEMNEDALRENFINELQKWGPNFVQEGRKKCASLDYQNRDDKIELINLVINTKMYTEDQIAAMDETELRAAYDNYLKSEVDNKYRNYQNATSKEEKMRITLDLKRDNLTRDVSVISGADLTDRFDKANEERIIATYGNSLANIEADAAKVSGEVKDAQAALDEYLKSGKGKKAKGIDSAYSLADSAYKAKKLAEKQRQEDERNRARQNNNQ